MSLRRIKESPLSMVHRISSDAAVSGSDNNAQELFHCKMCDYETDVKYRFTKHVKYHSSAMIKCNICDFRTPYKWNLDRHLTNHNGEGSLHCPICNFSADFKRSISLHFQNHHQDLSDSRIAELVKIVHTRMETSESNNINFDDNLPILVDQNGELDRSRLSFVDPADILEKNGKIYFKKLKCPKLDCEFRAVWETELNRHLSRAHSVPIQRKSMPTLLPITQPCVSEISKPKSKTCIPKKRSTFLENLSQRLQKAAKVRTKTALRGIELSRIARKRSFELIKEDNYGEDISGIETSPGIGTIRAIHHKEAEVNGVSESEQYTTRKVYKCPHSNCNFWAKTPSRFHVHIIGHSNKKPFECSKCQYRSNWSWDVTKHIRLKGMKDSGHLRARVLYPKDSGEKKYRDYEKNKVLMKMAYSAGRKSPDLNKATSSNSSKRIQLEPEPVEETLKVNVPQLPVPKMPKLTRAPSHLFAETNAAHEQGHSPMYGSPPPLPSLKLINECRTFVETKMLSGGQIPLGDREISITNQGPQKSPSDLRYGEFDHSGPPLLQRTKLSTEEEKMKSWKCAMCPFRNENKSVVVVHIRQYNKKKKAIIIRMNESNFTNSIFENGSFSSHMYSSSKLSVTKETHQYTYVDDVFSCKFCPFKTNDLRHIETHSENHFSKPNNHFSCEFCSFSVLTQSELNEHVVLHGCTSSENSPVQLIRPEETPPKPPGAGSTYKKYHCIECPYVTDNRAKFQYHKQFHTSTDSPFKCDACSYNVSHKRLLHQHSRVHLLKDACENKVENLEEGQEELLDANTNGNNPQEQKSRQDSEDNSKNHPTVLVWGDGRPYRVYRCHSCPQIFEDLVELLQHESIHLTDDEIVHDCQELPLSLCKFCPARFINSNDLVVHSSFHHAISTYKCHTCSYSVKGKKDLESHMKVHGIDYQKKTQEYFLKLNKIKCPKCPARLPNEPLFQQHYGFHGRDSGYNCRICDFGADSANNLMLHEFIHNISAKAAKVERCLPKKTISASSFTIPSMEKIIFQGRRSANQLNDEACQGNPEFIYPTTIKNGKIKEKRYKCKKCPSAFEKQDQYNVHMGLHGSDQRYKCIICNYSVTYFANFAQHLKKHETQPEISKELLMALAVPISKIGNIPPMIFKCKSCPFYSDNNNDMNNHEIQHGQISPDLLPCQFCNFAATDKKDLVKHTKYHFESIKPNSDMFAPKGIELYDQRSGQEIYSEQENHTSRLEEGTTINVNFQSIKPNSDMFAPKGIELYDQRSGQEIYSEQENHTSRLEEGTTINVNFLSIKPNSDMFAPKGIELYDQRSGQEIYSEQENHTSRLEEGTTINVKFQSIKPNSDMFAPKGIELYDQRSEQEIYSEQENHTSRLEEGTTINVNFQSIKPNSDMFAPKGIELYDQRSGQEIYSEQENHTSRLEEGITINVNVHETQPEISKELLMELDVPISKIGNIPPMIFKCKSCPFYSANNNDMNNHEIQHGQISPDLLPCQFCNFAATDKKDLVKHTKYHFESIKPNSDMFAPKGIELYDQRSEQEIYSEQENHTSRLEEGTTINVNFQSIKPNSDMFAPKGIELYDQRSGQEIYSEQENHTSRLEEGTTINVNFLSIKPNSDMFAPKGIELYDQRSGQEIYSEQENHTSRLEEGTTINVNFQSIKPNSDMFAPKGIELYDQRSGQEIYSEQENHTSRLEEGTTINVNFQSIKPNSDMFAPKGIELYDQRSGQEIYSEQENHTSRLEEGTTINVNVHETQPEISKELLMELDVPISKIGNIPPMIFKCKSCPFHSDNNNDMNNHEIQHGQISPDLLPCQLCEFDATDIKDLIKHTKYHFQSTKPNSDMFAPKGIELYDQRSGQEIYSEQENHTSRLEEGTTINVNVHETQPEISKELLMELDVPISKIGNIPPMIFKCKSCPFHSDNNNDMNNHEIQHGQISPDLLPCQLCEFDATDIKDLIKHTKYHFQSTKPNSDMFAPKGIELYDQRSGQEIYSEQENHTSRLEEGTTINVNVHETQPEISEELLMGSAVPISKIGNRPPKIFKCKSCPFHSDNKNDMNNHEIQHGKISPDLLPCQFCNFAATDKKDLVKHTKYHFQSPKPDSYMFAPKGIELYDKRTGQKIYSEQENHTSRSEEGTTINLKNHEDLNITYIDMSKCLPLGMCDEEEDE